MVRETGIVKPEMDVTVDVAGIDKVMVGKFGVEMGLMVIAMGDGASIGLLFQGVGAG